VRYYSRYECTSGCTNLLRSSSGLNHVGWREVGGDETNRDPRNAWNNSRSMQRGITILVYQTCHKLTSTIICHYEHFKIYDVIKYNDDCIRGYSTYNPYPWNDNNSSIFSQLVMLLSTFLQWECYSTVRHTAMEAHIGTYILYFISFASIIFIFSHNSGSVTSPPP
jgi:hypothetical protein